jgi:hypothetical protein
MFDRIEYLQKLIDKEAEGRAFYSDYPPKKVELKPKMNK